MTPDPLEDRDRTREAWDALASWVAVWLAAATYVPLTAPAAQPSPGSHHLYRLSPVPAGADWTS